MINPRASVRKALKAQGSKGEGALSAPHLGDRALRRGAEEVVYPGGG